LGINKKKVFLSTFLTLKAISQVQNEEKEMIYSKRVRAGKRTYFFDVRTTKAKDYYLTVTESRRQQRDGEFYYEKSKLFIYKEDFNKFADAMQETIDHIKSELLPDFDFEQYDRNDDFEPKPTAAPEADMPKVEVEQSKGGDDDYASSNLKWD
jgi:hypothetical protein